MLYQVLCVLGLFAATTKPTAKSLSPARGRRSVLGQKRDRFGGGEHPSVSADLARGRVRLWSRVRPRHSRTRRSARARLPRCPPLPLALSPRRRGSLSPLPPPGSSRWPGLSGVRPAASPASAPSRRRAVGTPCPETWAGHAGGAAARGSRGLTLASQGRGPAALTRVPHARPEPGLSPSSAVL